MEMLLSVWEFFQNNILTKPAFFIGFIVLAGYALLGKKWYECLAGFIKGTVGYMILNVASGGLVGNFRPVLAGLMDPQVVVMLGILLGTYWAVASNLTVEPVAKLTEGGGFATVYQQMFGIFLVSLQAARNAGFDYVEMSIDETDAKLARLDMTDGEIDAVRAAMRATGVPFRSICLSGHRKFPLGCPDRQKQDRSLEIMQKAIALAAKLRNAIRWPLPMGKMAMRLRSLTVAVVQRMCYTMFMKARTSSLARTARPMKSRATS